MKVNESMHPSKTWLKKKTKEMVFRDVRFMEKLEESALNNECLNKENDYFRCLVWEYKRTRFFTDPSFKDAVLNITDFQKKGEVVPFPFCVPSWPEKPYLSHSPRQRKNWEIESNDWLIFGLPKFKYSKVNLDASLSFDELTTEQKRGPVTLFSPDTHTESNSPPFTFNGIELSEVPLSSKVPVVFHLDVDLNKSNLGKAVNERWPEIQAQILIEQQKRPDARFVKNERKKLLPHLETELRQLGVYRILACCGDDLPWYQIIEIYGNDLTQDKYSSDKLFRKEVQKKSKHLYPDLQNFQKLPLREI